LICLLIGLVSSQSPSKQKRNQLQRLRVGRYVEATEDDTQSSWSTFVVNSLISGAQKRHALFEATLQTALLPFPTAFQCDSLPRRFIY
jgi:hypothetical protein